MEALKFNLWGLGACFTRPHINSVFSTYSHIHKVALLGMLGAIIGIEKDGTKKGEIPNFYKELRNLKVSIIPKKPRFFTVDNVVTETSCMFNTNKDGSTYLAYYKELYRPSWDVYILNDNSDNYNKIKEYIIAEKKYFLPYLGKNHFHGTIEEAKILECEDIDLSDIVTIDSLFPREAVELGEYEDVSVRREYIGEFMPVALDDKLNQYIETYIILTNNPIADLSTPGNVKKCDDKILYFL